ncbi:MAG: dynamin family protein, partial [Bacteroidota bacterium]
MNWTELEPKASRIRETVLDLLDQVSAEQKRGAMPAPGAGFVKAREALRNPEVDVVVCGEVKRGKSTFINALLGKELLPTGVRETTSQVFRVSHAVKESFALVFEDGHREPITAQQL